MSYQKESAIRILFVLLTILFPTFGRAQDDPEVPGVIENRVSVSFPRSITYHLELAAGHEISSVGLRYGTEARTCQPTGAFQPVEPTADGTTFSWTWDLVRYGTLPAFSEIWWQWEFEDRTGRSFSAPREIVQLADDNFTFRELATDDVAVYWVVGDEAFATFLSDLAARFLSKLERDFGLEVPRPVKLIVYPSASDMRAALIHIPEWSGGVAFPAYNSIMAVIPPGERAWAEQVISHEMGHLVVGAVTFNCLGRDLPVWLSEGLATYAEGPLTAHHREKVDAALAANTLPQLRSYARSFSAYAGDANLAYAHSAHVVHYLAERFGPDKLGVLLSAMQAGESVDEALSAVYGFDTDGLDSTWRQSLGYQPLPTRPAVTSTATVVPTLPPLGLTLPTAVPAVSPTMEPGATPTAPAPTPDLTSQTHWTPVSVSQAEGGLGAPAPLPPESNTFTSHEVAEEQSARPETYFVALGVTVLVVVLIISMLARRTLAGTSGEGNH